MARFPRRSDLPRLPRGSDVRDNVVRLRRGIARRVRIPRIPRLPTIISPADVLTLANAFSGLLAIAVLTEVVNLYEPPFFPGLENVWPAAKDDRFLLASILLALGMVFDSLDGLVARKFGGSRLGGDLDTLADATTFVTLPAILVMTFYGDVNPFRAFMVGALVFIMGILRLARFNANTGETETLTFQGLPSPWCAITIALTVLAQIPAILALPLITVLAFLMMSNVAYPKSRERVRYLTYLMVVSALVIIAFIVWFPDVQSRILRTAFVIVALTVAVFPFLIARRERKQRRAARQEAARGDG